MSYNRMLTFKLEENFFPSYVMLLGVTHLDLDATFELEDESFDAVSVDGVSRQHRCVVAKPGPLKVYAGSRPIGTELEEHLPTLWKAVTEFLDDYAGDLTEDDFSE